MALLIPGAAPLGNALITFLRLDRDAPIAYPSNVAERFCLLTFVIMAALYLVGGLLLLRRKGSRQAGKPALLTALAVLFFFVTWETALRLYASFLSPTTFQPDAYLLWSMRPNLRGSIHEVPSGPMVINTNSLGLREREIPFERRAGETRILFIGDSWTWGHGVKEEETFVRVLETMLRAHFPGREIVTINGGVPGFSAVQGFSLLKRLGPLYRPDIVVVAGFNRTSTRRIGEVKRAVVPESPRGTLQSLLQRFAVYQCLRKTVSRFTSPPVQPPSAASMDERSREEIRSLTREYFGKLDDEVVSLRCKGLFFDHLNSLKPGPPFERAASPRSETPPGEYVLSPRRTTEALMRKDGVYNLELHTPLRASPGFWIAFDATQHPGPAGHREIAASLFKALLGLELLREKEGR